MTTDRILAGAAVLTLVFALVGAAWYVGTTTASKADVREIGARLDALGARVDALAKTVQEIAVDVAVLRDRSDREQQQP